MVDSQPIAQLFLAEIIEREIPGITKSQAAYHLEACLVCLDQHQHQSGLLMRIEGVVKEQMQVIWDDLVDEQVRRSWGDVQEATEEGAVAIAILLILRYTPYTIIERSAKGTGFDYWLIEEEFYSEHDIFSQGGSARLEVSGILHAKNDREIKSRVKQKRRQTDVSDDERLPAYIAVTEFSRPFAHLVRK